MSVEIITETEFRKRWTLSGPDDKTLLEMSEYKAGVHCIGEIRDEAAIVGGRESNKMCGIALDSRLFDGLCGLGGGYNKELHGKVAGEVRDAMIVEANKLGANVLVPTMYEETPLDGRIPVAGYAFRIEQ